MLSDFENLNAELHNEDHSLIIVANYCRLTIAWRTLFVLYRYCSSLAALSLLCEQRELSGHAKQLNDFGLIKALKRR